MTEIVLCKKCGNEMEYHQEKYTCGWICPVCGDGAVTTYVEPIDRDYTMYSLRVSAQNPFTDAIKASSKVFGCNYLEARKGLLEGSLLTSGNAREIQNKAIVLQGGSVAFQIEPVFPYQISTQ